VGRGALLPVHADPRRGLAENVSALLGFDVVLSRPAISSEIRQSASNSSKLASSYPSTLDAMRRT
jgi:hypothetical protein